MQNLDEAFPIPYAHMYAAKLFLLAGHPANEVYARFPNSDRWAKDVSENYHGIMWSAYGEPNSTLKRLGVVDSSDERRLYDHLIADGGIEPAVMQPFDLGRQLAKVRKVVERNPRIGPFADVDWVAEIIGDRQYRGIVYMHDGHSVFALGNMLHDEKLQALPGVDALSFEQLGDRWFRDKNHVYAQAQTPTRIFWYVVRNADVENFRVLNEYYAADKSALYYVTKKRFPVGAPETLEVVGYHIGHGLHPGYREKHSAYVKSSDSVYAFGALIEGADASSFHSIGDEGGYFADRNRVYFEQMPMEGVDRESFVCGYDMGQYAAYDKNRPYYRGLPNSPETAFKDWCRYFESRPDLTDTWWHREKLRREELTANSASISSADSSTNPRPIGGIFFSDGNRILVQSRDESSEGKWCPQEHFDLASFKPLVDMFGQDKHGLRYVVPRSEDIQRLSVADADTSSFRALGDGWYRDAKRVYFLDAYVPRDQRGLVIVKADLATFEVIGGAYARDSKGLIVEGIRKRGIADPKAVVALGYQYARMGDVILFQGRPVTRAPKVDVNTARGLPDGLLIDANGRMLLGSLYRKPLPVILNPASLRFLNRVFVSDEKRVYAIREGRVVPIPDWDPASVEVASEYKVRVGGVTYWYWFDGNELRSCS